MDSIPQFLLGLGGILLLGLATDLLGKRTFLPRVTLLLVFGVLIGQEGFDIIPQLFLDRFDLIANMALLFHELLPHTLVFNKKRCKYLG